MKTTVRIAVAILAIVMFLCAFAGCGQKKKNTEEGGTTAKNTGTNEGEKKTNLPDKIWNRDFDIAGYSLEDTYGFITEEGANDPVSEQVARRNNWIEETYGITVTYKPYRLLNGGEHDIFDMVRKDYLNGKTDYELISANQGESSLMISELPYLMDFNSQYLTYLDLDNPCWNQDIREKLSIKNHLFMLSGDMNITEKGSLMTMLYNREMIAKQNLPESLPDLVRNGEWTVEKYEEIMKQFSVIDGNGNVMQYGAVYSQHYMAFLAGCGIQICDKDENDLPVLAVNNEKTIDIVDKTLKVCCWPLSQNDKIIYYQRMSSQKEPNDYFKAGIAAFTSARLNVILTELRGVENFTMGYLPFPKYNAEQEDYLTYDYGYRTAKLLIPYMVEDAAFASFGLQALGENSADLNHQYLEVQCKIKGAVDEEQFEMLNIATAHPVYDIGMVYDFSGIFLWLFCDSYTNTIGYKNYEAIAVSGTNNFSTLYAVYGPAAQAEIEKYIKGIQYLDTIDY